MNRGVETATFESLKKRTKRRFRDEAQPNASRPLDRAAVAAGAIEGVLTYRSLTTKLASWASRSHPDPVVIVVKEQAVVTAGGAAIVDEAIKFLEAAAPLPCAIFAVVIGTQLNRAFDPKRFSTAVDAIVVALGCLCLYSGYTSTFA